MEVVVGSWDVVGRVALGVCACAIFPSVRVPLVVRGLRGLRLFL